MFLRVIQQAIHLIILLTIHKVFTLPHLLILLPITVGITTVIHKIKMMYACVI